jgi:thiamine-phosphate pyrophosphorylase
MKPEFTPAAWRVLTEAACWTNCSAEGSLDLPELLLGLLAEEECRAAAILTSSGIDVAAVQQRWPLLRRVGCPGPLPDFSPAVHAAVSEARHRLRDLPQPLCLATEHLLLGILAAPSEASAWLREYALSAEAVESQIFRWEGVTPGPLKMEEHVEFAMRNAELGTAKPLAGGFSGGVSARSAAATVSNSAIRNPQSAILRILDASANRAREALRVIEDYVRFVLDDRRLSSDLKSMRHALAQLLARLPTEALLASRDTLGDVGTSISTPTERSRADLRDVLTANFKRLQEALRSLEEYSKTIDPEAAAGMEQLRYQVYTIEQAVELDRGSRELLSNARLYVLIDGGESPEAFERLAQSLINAGVHVLQLRDKRLADRELLDRARRLRELTKVTQTLFIMNDRPDLAVLSNADGVHVGQEELTVGDARAILGPRGLIGVSTHSITQAREAVREGADYIGVGPTFPSATKHFEHFTGVDLLRAVSAEICLPAFAIGGIALENLSEVLATGITRVAVGSAIADSSDPSEAARGILHELHGR